MTQQSPGIAFSRSLDDLAETLELRDLAFNRHSYNKSRNVSPFAEGAIDVGTDRLEVRLVRGIDEQALRRTLGRAVLATLGVDPNASLEEMPWEEMFRGGLQTALEGHVIWFEVFRPSRTATHQIVRSRRAAFHQQSQRASFMGDRPNVRMPESIWRNERAREAFIRSVEAAWEAYRIACDEDIAYQDARFILPEGTETYILCEYSVGEFIKLHDYRACSMFQWEIMAAVREMRRVLVAEHPWLDRYIKISCERTGPVVGEVGDVLAEHHCTFQGWESVEGQCPFPWAREEFRTYKPDRDLSITR